MEKSLVKDPTMNKSVKATLLNALLFPGLGQLSLGKKLRGWLYISLMLVFLILLMRYITIKAKEIISGIDLSSGQLDIAAVSERVSAHLSQDASAIGTLAILGMVTIWVIAIIDGIITGNMLDQADADLDDTSEA